MGDDQLREHGVIPDVIEKEPPYILDVTYPNNLIVYVGQVLTCKQSKIQPKVEWNSDPDTYYTLCMIDPDFPSRDDPVFSEMNHWLVGNIPDNDIGKGDVIAEYMGPSPPEGTGLHRFVLLVFEQSEKCTFNEKRRSTKTDAGRRNFSYKQFAEKYGLGEPIAVNMYRTLYDDYFP